MGKSGGFLEIKRKEKELRDTKERISDFKEINIKQNDIYVKDQAARCMDCGVPFCHMACPVDNICPEWQDLAYKGEWERAIEVLHATNPFPEFTGKICPAPCEGSCTLGINDEPITIKNIELAIVENAWEKGWIKPKIAKHKLNKKVAVIGSGPSGLAAAQGLTRFGYDVTVYEKDEMAGGLLTFGIPDFKLDKSVIERRVEQMKLEGTKFVYNTQIGKDISVKEIDEQNDAVIIACGSKKPRNLQIQGRHYKGIHYAMDFLTQQNRKNNNIPLYDEEIVAKGKNVLVIGGGDTGADCVGTSVRQGAKNIFQVEILDKPPVTREESNPWPEYPLILRYSTSHKESAEKYGHDPREWNITTKEFIADENGNVKGVKVAKVESKLENDRLVFQEIPNTEFIIEADLVFLAIGFVHPYHEGLIEKSHVEIDGRGNIKANDKDYKTTVEKYFAAGDVRRGQSLVVWAIREGRDVAKSVHKYLKNKN